MTLVIIDYGIGNTKSVQFAFKRIGKEAVLSSNPREIEQADRVIFPGVGEASSAIKALKKKKLDKVIPQLKQPVLGICLGMQLLCNTTQENKTKGLGVFNVDIKRFSKKVKAPQIGWNTITNLKSNLFKGINSNSFMYFVHSYYALDCMEAIANTYYEYNFASALQKDNFYGVQFHPEKSSLVGEQILKNFLTL